MSVLGKAFALFLGASMVGSATQIAKGKISAVFLGAEGVGALNQLTTMWNLLNIGSQLGFYNGIVRNLTRAEQANDQDLFRSQLSSSLVFLLSWSLILSAVVTIFSASISNFIFVDGGAKAGYVALIALATPLAVAGQVYRALLNARQSVTLLVRSRVAADILSVVVLAILIAPYGLTGAVLAFIGLHLIFLIFTAAFAIGEAGRKKTTPSLQLANWADVRRNAADGANGLITVSAGIVTALLVQRIVIASVSLAAAGLYSVASKVSALYLGGLYASAGAQYFPTLLRANNNQEVSAAINEAIRLYMHVLSPLIVMLIACGKIFMWLFFSSEFIPAAELLIYILPGDMFRMVAETVGLALLARERRLVSSGLYLAWAAGYVVAASFLIGAYGLMGAGYAYLVTHVALAIVVVGSAAYLLDYRLDRPTLLTLLRGFAAVGCAAVVTANVPNLYLEVVFGTIVVALWFALSWLDLEFRSLTQKTFRFGLKKLGFI